MNIQTARGLDGYLQFLALVLAEIKAAAAAWSIIEPHMQGLVEQFYDHLFSIGLATFFKDVNLTRLKQKQRAYWGALFVGKFDQIYRMHIDKIGAQHDAAGVKLTDYIGSYAWFSERFFKIISRSSPPIPYQRHTLLIATNKIIYLDMMIAVASSEAHLLDL